MAGIGKEKGAYSDRLRSVATWNVGGSARPRKSDEIGQHERCGDLTRSIAARDGRADTDVLMMPVNSVMQDIRPPPRGTSAPCT